MSRCYYYAVRLKNGTAQILASRASNAALMTSNNTKLLPERRTIADTQQLGLEWLCQDGGFSQAAIALLAHATTGTLITRRYAQRFQAEVLAQLPSQGWVLRADQVRHWVAVQRHNEQAKQASGTL
jgi:hypothetical protein